MKRTNSNSKNRLKAASSSEKGKANAEKLTSRIFLASTQCLGSRQKYLIAFGAEM